LFNSKNKVTHAKKIQGKQPFWLIIRLEDQGNIDPIIHSLKLS
jgi:hypothetical protein